MIKKKTIIVFWFLILISFSLVSYGLIRNPHVIASKNEINQEIINCRNTGIGGYSFKGVYILHDCKVTNDYVEAFYDSRN